MSEIRENLEKIRKRIDQAAKRSGRDPDRVQLIAVSKKMPAEFIEEAISYGQKSFGENYLQEAVEKIKHFATDISWHFIGRLQSNKAAAVADSFTMVETVDRLKIARALDRYMKEQGRVLPILIQVNIGSEPQKSGVLPEDTVGLLTEMQALSGLLIKGLMVMPPYSPDPEATRPYFRRTRELAENLQGKGLLASQEAVEISMGMSGDFEVAVEEGATLVRIGTALFGQRRR
jgi:pyridoxal phosphate enzyme (YggS family)